MASDFVQRLRKGHCKHGDCIGLTICACVALDEAADRIEALEAALSRCAEAYEETEYYDSELLKDVRILLAQGSDK